MAELEAGKANPNPEAAKQPAKPAVDATKYVGRPRSGPRKQRQPAASPELRPRPRSTAIAGASYGPWSQAF